MALNIKDDTADRLARELSPAGLNFGDCFPTRSQAP
jgi:hypothetical protein